MRLTFCALCDCAEAIKLELHHVVPRAEGSSDEECNLLIACDDCHSIVHGMRRRSNIATLTRAGLQRAKARGVKRGSPLRSLQLPRRPRED